jgi:hypothetical protein
MTRKLESLFDFPPNEDNTSSEPTAEPTAEPTRRELQEIDQAIDKIDSALPMVRDLDTGDKELDDLAAKAQETFDNLMDLGFNVDSRYASEIFAVAGAMLGHALNAKTAKLNKKLKMVELQMKKVKLDRDAQTSDEPTQTAHGQVLSRNDLLEMIKGAQDQNITKA